jgi:thiol-disulfide isomerase/thioredoxin
MSKPILDDLIERYDYNKNNIDKHYQSFFQEYIKKIKIQKTKGVSKGDRKFVERNFKPVFWKLLSDNGFKVFDEINLYDPTEEIPILDNLVKEKFKDFKETKNIDFIAIKNKKILFIEMKMTASSNALLSGLFELGLIDDKKIPSDYEPYFIIVSDYTNDPEKYQKIFNILRKIFIEDHLEKNCMFVLLDPQQCKNEEEFYKILSA